MSYAKRILESLEKGMTTDLREHLHGGAIEISCSLCRAKMHVSGNEVRQWPEYPREPLSLLPHSADCAYRIAKELEEIETLIPLVDLVSEWKKADAKHGKMLEPIEGLYTLRCEVMELAREIHRVHKDPEAATNEARQVVVMGLKFIRDCIPLLTDNGDHQVVLDIKGDIVDSDQIAKLMEQIHTAIKGDDGGGPA